MQSAINWFYRFIEVVLVLLLTGMVVMVFGNVFLRYALNTGWQVSEELSRFFFVWVTFIGAVLTYREFEHIGIEILVARFSNSQRLFCMALSNLIIMGCSFVFAWGAWQQLGVNASMRAPVSGLSLAWLYGVGIFTGGCMSIIAAHRLLTVVTGKTSDTDMARFVGELSDPGVEQRS